MTQKKKNINFGSKAVNFGVKPVKKNTQAEQPPAISSALDDFEIWFTANWKKAAAGVAAVLAIIVIVIVGNYARTSHDKAVRKALVDASAMEDLQEAISRYSDHPSANEARQKLAALCIEKGDLAKAAEMLNAVANSGTADLHTRARAALDGAYIMEKQGKNDVALTEFSKIAGNTLMNESIRAEANYSAARLSLAKGDSAKAAEYIGKINLSRVDDNSGTYGYWASLALALTRRLPAPAVKK